jgi:hypothetical protein
MVHRSDDRVGGVGVPIRLDLGVVSYRRVWSVRADLHHGQQEYLTKPGKQGINWTYN